MRPARDAPELRHSAPSHMRREDWHRSRWPRLGARHRERRPSSSACDRRAPDIAALPKAPRGSARKLRFPHNTPERHRGCRLSPGVAPPPSLPRARLPPQRSTGGTLRARKTRLVRSNPASRPLPATFGRQIRDQRRSSPRIPGYMSVRHSPSRHSFASVMLALWLLAPVGAPATIMAPPGFQVSGRVTDARGAPLQHAMVSVRDIERRITIAGTTDGAGRYRLHGLAQGTYRVVVSGDGRYVSVRDSVRLSAASVIDLRAGVADGPRARTSAEVLNLLPDGEEKRRFILDCTGCHQLDERVAALPDAGR